MSLYTQWTELAESKSNPQDYEAFWQPYFAAERDNYQKILAEKNDKVEGTVADLAATFSMDKTIFMGFLDGINTSLRTELTLEEVEESSTVALDIDFEKLYWNMHDAKAEWLYTLEEWDGILSKERRDEITKDFKKSQIAVSNKVGRNDPCPCGSGKKFKKCCGVNA